MRIRGLLIVAGVAFMLMTGSASATRYADPAGTAANACTLVDPCNAEKAIEGASNFEQVFLAAGSYTVTADITAGANNMTVLGVGNPTLNFDAGFGMFVLSTGASYRGFSVTGSVTSSGLVQESTGGAANNTFYSLNIQNALGGPAAVVVPTSLIADSFLLTNGSPTVVLELGGTSLNNTVIASSGTSAAIETGDSYFPSHPVSVVRNTIARAGGTRDLSIEEVGAGAHSSMVVDHSNYRFANTGGGTITPGAGNQDAALLAPLLASTTDPHQSAGSPTIDAGISDPSVGPFDLLGEARVSRCAIDIGADEFDAACPTPGGSGPAADVIAPTISGLKATKKKGKLKTFDFTSSEAGIATFKFTKKKGKKFKSAGSQTKAVKAGKNSIKPKKLKKGSYKLTLTVKDASGNVSLAKKLSFKIK